jgi:hypothetical protein
MVAKSQLRSQLHRIVDFSFKSSAFHKTEELHGDQSFLFIADLKGGVVSAGIEVSLRMAG